ncbi:conserved hypothetical protein [Tistlia consotensis]|uniref:Lysylphosphatidylglycerol synthase TM region n=1 Tax=Tistlia consotensis USBA 355 TaxID=560819 RepID=A0A1Y6BE41_9PROT|nr:lysylphosphatidylglycerol synthase transmembrane domain-containing protein [Tistlia consotensis]SME98781.1 conserved hypothetical protein [Tistlia consotensis USBA 355]SNR58184.1 conserved hypothetical protein [Tistlia consotensis]
MIFRVLRIVVAIGLVAALFHFDLIQVSVLRRLFDEPLKLAAAVALLLMTTPLAAARWHALLRCQGFRPTLAKVVQITFIGQFFNNFLPGSYGGDAVRLGFLYKASGKGLSRLLFSLVIDRLAGLLGLVTLGLVALLLLNDLSTSALAFSLLGFVGVVLVCGSIAALFGERLVDLLKPLQGGPLRKLHSFAREILQGFRLYFGSPGVLGLAWAISLAQFMLVSACLLLVADLIHVGVLSWLGKIIVGTLSLIVNAVPLSPGGIGLGETSYEHFARIVEHGRSAAPYATVFLAFRVVGALCSLPGAALFLIYKQEVTEYVHVQPPAPRKSAPGGEGGLSSETR